ncbi:MULTISPECIES: PQQ-dependent sugar dehydrogenase [Candidatus Accumulibacter]|jgi:glucose/arabinose dehydrogenase|uniref:Putative membrane-bound dehydrogenase domain protein n=1 Tax=Candidatus Accumulibacter phosphatis TaxID=327160 RepID=A0A080M5N4_9PROT|nr:PQQ-dependent sugar dehydrogenase [Accumulibacter sp.]KFB72379.1 MAG: putative membrane-bound dehydrogenase domain protein [Candidatus Accumulibacter phosphatis]HRF10525.1 PQQ-dependent sugar dehydrogenase [Candidatus Accumulibacter phosphatis]
MRPLLTLTLLAWTTIALALPLETIKLPPGFAIELWARVDNARQMALGSVDAQGGVLYVGSMRAGKVHALRFDASYRAGTVTRIAEGLQLPTGLAWRKGALYVAAVNRILRYDDIDRRLDQPPAPVIVTDSLPKDTHHGWKFIAFGPDGKLYVPVGAPCNICAPGDSHAVILRMHADGSGREVFARGVRNSVGFDWNPVDGVLWFTDNGRDWLGDDSPPDELNRAPRPAMHFGFPYCHGGELADPEFGAQRRCSEFEPPAQKLGPHVASLGMRFYTGSMFPAEYSKQIFIAEHGSWNRSRKIGYRISLVRVQNGRAVAYETFASGWLQNESAWGRPADVQTLPDGSLLVADDHAGAIYRITWKKP